MLTDKVARATAEFAMASMDMDMINAEEAKMIEAEMQEEKMRMREGMEEERAHEVMDIEMELSNFDNQLDSMTDDIQFLLDINKSATTPAADKEANTL